VPISYKPDLKIKVTKNYQLFKNAAGCNRPLELARHRGLLESMKLYGCLLRRRRWLAPGGAISPAAVAAAPGAARGPAGVTGM
jgi:hypothetical protein